MDENISSSSISVVRCCFQDDAPFPPSNVSFTTMSFESSVDSSASHRSGSTRFDKSGKKAPAIVFFFLLDFVLHIC